MSASNNNNDKPPSFWQSIKDGYAEEDKKVKQDTAPLTHKIVEGITVGVTETVAHPFRWLRTLLK